jgi:hypothetical protein
MKQKLLARLAALALGLAPAAMGQTLPIFENWGAIVVPGYGQIDATAFVNHKGGSVTYTGPSNVLFNTFNTINYTNQGLMSAVPGFDFETVPTGSGLTLRASNFVNQISGGGTNSGVINCGVGLPLVGDLSGSSKILVLADYIENSGQINMSQSSLIKLAGKNIKLARGSLFMSNPSESPGQFAAGELDGYWGVGSAGQTYPSNVQASLLIPANLLIGQTPFYTIFTRGNLSITNFSMALVNPLTYVSDSNNAAGTTRTIQAVLLADTSPGFLKSVFFSPAQIAVQWQWSATAWPSGVTSTNNYLYLTDNFAEGATLGLTTNGAAGPRPTLRPSNYNLIQANTPFAPGTGSSAVLPPADIFGTDTVTNQYAAYEAIFTSGTRLAGDVAGGNVTNMPGRIELTADTTLDLNEARISALSYLLLSATNQFLGSSNAQIAAPNLDILLRSTNSSISISNLVSPYMNHLSGTIELWSARWTNNATGTNTTYHVLFVRSALAPASRPVVQTLDLNATNFYGAPTNNLFLSDVLNVSSNLLLKAENITITTNPGNTFAPVGQLNYLNPAVLWTTNLMPRLHCLTNLGVLSMLNQVYFSEVYAPLQALVNRGTVSNQGSFILTRYMENSGVWDVGGGSINLAGASNVVLNSGTLRALNGEINLGMGSLWTSNSVILSGGVLNLQVTNLIDDGSLAANSADAVTNQSFWTAANGFNFPVLPPQASLLATTISNSAVDYQSVVSQWSGVDRGCVPSGFSNNAAVGHLILQGSYGSGYQFVGSGVSNALYVDLLEFRDFVATNVDNFGNFPSASCAPNMKIYFGQALANGRSIAEKLSQVNGGRFCWVSNYSTGFFSSTNMVYPDGTTNRLNAALVASCDIDSNCNGIPNCIDSAPVPVPSPRSLALTVAFTNQPIPAAQVSWTAFPGTINILYAASDLGSAHWNEVTNFVYTALCPGRVSVNDSINANAPRFYRVSAGSP